MCLRALLNLSEKLTKATNIMITKQRKFYTPRYWSRSKSGSRFKSWSDSGSRSWSWSEYESGSWPRSWYWSWSWSESGSKSKQTI